jgi:hypothetical protein
LTATPTTPPESLSSGRKSQPTEVSFFDAWDAKKSGNTYTSAASLPADGDHAARYARGVLAGCRDEMLRTPIGSGRNHALNVAALRSYRIHLAAGLDTDEVTQTLGAADGGLDHPATRRTLQSALDAARQQGPALIPDRSPRAPWQQSDDPLAVGYAPIIVLPTASDARVDVADPSSTWTPVDLAGHLDGTHEPTRPTLMSRTDGECLLYAGLVHSVHGESESGKSLVLQLLAADLVNAGQPVLYLDFESDPAAVTDRMLQLGAQPDALRAHFRYVQPETRPDATRGDAAAVTALLADRYTLAVVDGVTDALSVHGGATKENDDITAWMRAVPKRIAADTGAAVVLVDHVTKSTEERGRFAIGGQAKMAGLTGAAYTVVPVEPLGRGMRGVITLRIGKDRPGGIRPHSGPWRKTDRTQEAARVIIDATGGDGITRWTVEPWQPPGASTDTAGGFRPTTLMERVSRYVEGNPQASTRDIRTNITGKESAVLTALALLVSEGYVTAEQGPRNSVLHTHARSYRQATDPLSDAQPPGTTQAVEPVPDEG